jgi:hypothetical protein
MADITIYVDLDPSITLEVVRGAPPADQAALVAQLQADNAALTAEIAVAKTDAAKVVADLA